MPRYLKLITTARGWLAKRLLLHERPAEEHQLGFFRQPPPLAGVLKHIELLLQASC
jgi:hypothetical protein